jgi:hypothetical protein
MSFRDIVGGSYALYLSNAYNELQQKTLLTPPAAATGSPYTFKVTGAAHTTLTASTEAIDVDLALARTVQFSTGALATQRAVVIRPPTYGFVGASTITNAVTVDIAGAPVAGTNATITNKYALRVQGEMLVTPGADFLKINTTGIGFFGATPVAQPAGVADATGGAIIDAEARAAINALISRIEATGLIATV